MLAKLLSNVSVQRNLASFGVRFLPPVVRLGSTIIVLGWKEAAEVLSRDDDFRIEPINKDRIVGVSGPFFLGMDRSPDYFQQRGCGYGAMAQMDLTAQARTILDQARTTVENAGSELDVVADYSRNISASTATAIFGLTKPDRADLLRVSRAVFHESFLNLNNNSEIQKRGRAAGHELTAWMVQEIAERRGAPEVDPTDFLDCLVADETLGDADIANIANGYFVGSIETTATVVANVLFELISDKRTLSAAIDSVDDPRRMMGWCMEALRRRPHNALLLREAACNTSLAGVEILKGDRVTVITLAAHNDPSVFSSPGLMDPSRPLRGYMHFGYGPHACAGRDVNFVQIPTLVAEVLRRKPTGVDKIEYEGPFPTKLIVSFGG